MAEQTFCEDLQKTVYKLTVNPHYAVYMI